MTPTAAAPKPSPSALRPTLRSAVGRPVPRACAVLTHGLGLGLTSGAIRRYTIHNAGDPALRAVAQNLTLWSALTTSAARKVAGSSSLAGRAELRRTVASRLVARLVLPAVIPAEKDTIQPSGGSDGIGAENRKLAIRDTIQPSELPEGSDEAGVKNDKLTRDENGKPLFTQPMRPAVTATERGTSQPSGQWPEGSGLADGDNGQWDTNQPNGQRPEGTKSVGAEAGKLSVRDTDQPREHSADSDGVGGKPLFTQRRVISARHAMAVIGTGFIRGTSAGFEGDYVNELNLAAGTGTSPAAARANLQALEAMGWLTCTKRQKGSAAKYKLAPLPKRVETASAPFLGIIELLGDRTMLMASDDDLGQKMSLEANDLGQNMSQADGGEVMDVEVDEDLAAVLADQPDDAYAVQVLESARHAAWTYSRPSAKADRTTGPDAPADLVVRDWVYLWAVATGADPSSLGLSVRECTSARKDLKRSEVGPAYPGSLTEQLDRVAARTGATDRYRAAWAVRNEARVKRTTAARAIQTAAGRNQTGPDRLKVVLDRVAGSVPAVPTDGPSKGALMDWVSSVRAAVRAELSGGLATDGLAKLPSWTGPSEPIRTGVRDRLAVAGFSTVQAETLSRAAVPV